MTIDVPFIENTDDALHCQQAAYFMIAKHFDPDFSINWEEWSRVTGFEEDKGTWAFAGLLWFHNHGYEVKHITKFDMEAFIQRGEEYILEISGPEVGRWEIEHSNIPLEQKRSKELLETDIYINREPTINDIKDFLKQGFLVKVLVNSRRLNGQEGYFGHAVVVVGFDDENIIFHNPGPPAAEKQKASYKDFEIAWADPNVDVKELDAIRLSK
jgi:hypothetical protein